MTMSYDNPTITTTLQIEMEYRVSELEGRVKSYEKELSDTRARLTSTLSSLADTERLYLEEIK